MENIKTLASILNELKTSVMLMLLIAWLTPLVGLVAVQFYVADRMANSFEVIAAESKRQTEIDKERLQHTARLATWIQNDEKRDTALNAELIRYLHKAKP